MSSYFPLICKKVSKKESFAKGSQITKSPIALLDYSVCCSLLHQTHAPRQVIQL